MNYQWNLNHKKILGVTKSGKKNNKKPSNIWTAASGESFIASRNKDGRNLESVMRRTGPINLSVVIFANKVAVNSLIVGSLELQNKSRRYITAPSL